MKEETLKEIIAWLRDPKIKSPMRKSWREVLANRLEVTAKRAYEKIDKAVTGIEGASSSEIDEVREVMERTIGDYYE